MIQSVDRAVRILTTLQGGRRMSLGELATALALPPSTVHGIVRTLTAHGMVVQERDSGRYRLGPATLRLGNVYLDTLDLRTRVATWATALAQQTGLAVRTGVLLLDRRDRRRTTCPGPTTPSRCPRWGSSSPPTRARWGRRCWPSTPKRSPSCSRATTDAA